MIATFSCSDRTALRGLARWGPGITALPVQAEQRALWVQHKGLQRARPMILVFSEGS